jgi:Domain of unknown function (DUF222)
MDQNEGSERSGAGGPGAEGIEAAGDAVLGALGLIRSGIAQLTEAALWARCDAACRDGVREGFTLLQSLDSAWLGLVADLDSRPDAVPGARAGKIAQTFLRSGLLRTAAQASQDVRAAHALAPDADPCEGGMPGLGRAFASGRTSREHVEVALRAVRKLPKKVLREPVPTADEPTAPTPDGPHNQQDAESPQRVREVTAGEAVDAFFAHQSQEVDPTVTGRLARHLLDALDPDGHDGFDPEAHERRQLTHSTDSSGMIVGRFQLDPESGAWFVSAIEHFSAPNPTVQEKNDDGTSTAVRDSRCAAQRRADALALISRLALGSDQAGTGKSGEPPRIVVHAGVQDILDALRRGQRPDPAPHPGTSADTGSTPAPTPPVTLFDEDVEAPIQEATQNEAHENNEPEHDGKTPDDAIKQPTEQASQSEPGRDVEQMNAIEETAADEGPSQADQADQPSFPAGGVLGARGAECEQLGPIGPTLLGRFACDAVMQRVLLAPHGAVLDLGRETRTVNRAQRRALNARDRGCVVPGCGAPPEWCEAHHVIYWRDGGLTNIDGLALVCGHDHTLIHQGVWELTMINGVPWARPPRWIDPLQRLIRNTLHDRADEARGLGTQIRLVLPTGPEPDPPWAQPPLEDTG